MQWFNKDLQGLSGSGRAQDWNFAKSGSRLSDLSRQIRAALLRYRADSKAGELKGKICVIWVGSNNILYDHNFSIKKLKKQLLESLGLLTTNLELAIVVLMTLPPLPPSLDTERTRRRRKDFNTLLHVVAATYRWTELPQNVHIKLVEIPSPPEGDLTNYLSEIDGIHPNVEAQRLFAKAVWNGLFGKTYNNGQELKTDEWVSPTPDMAFALS